MHPAAMAALTVFLAGCLFYLGMILAAKLTSRPWRVLFLSVAVLFSLPAFFYIFYYTHLMDGAVWFYNLRIHSNTELLASGLGFLAGTVYASRRPETLPQKATIPLITLVALMIPFLKPLLDPLNYAALSANCAGEVCLQSTPSTCGPSSAATILRLFGDNASEKDLAQESFTSHGGTEIWYLARALQRRGYNTKVVAQPATSPLPPLPAIAGVTLPGGVGHFLAVLSESNSQVTLADPLRGRFQVPSADLQRAYHFTGFYLAIRRR